MDLSDRSSNIGRTRSYAYIRRPKIKVLVDRWDWKNREDLVDTIDLTDFLDGYRFTKTLAHPATQGILTVRPETEDVSLIGILEPMDVVRIYEFDLLRFQGFIRTIGYKGAMSPNGPTRDIQITISGFGSYLTDTFISVDLDIAKAKAAFTNAALKISNAIHRAGDKQVTYQRAVKSLVDAWFEYIQEVGTSTLQRTYIERYVNFTDGVMTTELPGYPAQLKLFYGSEDQLSLWTIIEKLLEVPFVEFFFDEPRDVQYENDLTVSYAEQKTYLIGRQTPFDGTIKDGVETDRFSGLTPIILPFPLLQSFDLNKSMDEVFTYYLAVPPMFSGSEMTLKAAGIPLIDPYLMKKYLYRMLKKDLYYSRVESNTSTAKDSNEQFLRLRSEDFAKTMANWYAHNDQFLSGAWQYHVSNNPREVPKIGDRFRVEGIGGDYYVQSVTHQWGYGRSLLGTASVIRGWDTDRDRPIDLKDKLFQRLPVYTRSKSQTIPIIKREERGEIPTE